VRLPYILSDKNSYTRTLVREGEQTVSGDSTSTWTKIDELRQIIDEQQKQIDKLLTERDTMYGEATRANARENDAIKRAEAAETALSAEFVYTVELVNRYGLEMWRRGVKGQPSVEFTHWKTANE